MLFKNVSQDEVFQAVAELNRDKYADNILIENIGRKSKNVISVKLGTANNREKGSRRTWSGRHGKYACTHVFEDVMLGILQRGGAVTIPKGMPGNSQGTAIQITDEYDLDNWVDAYNCTNVGSMMDVVYPEQLCVGCDEN